MLPSTESNTAVLNDLEESRHVAEPLSEKPETPVQHPGLCRNCDVRETCCYRRPKSIVLYCEEYQ